MCYHLITICHSFYYKFQFNMILNACRYLEEAEEKRKLDGSSNGAVEDIKNDPLLEVFWF